MNTTGYANGHPATFLVDQLEAAGLELLMGAMPAEQRYIERMTVPSFVTTKDLRSNLNDLSLSN